MAIQSINTTLNAILTNEIVIGLIVIFILGFMVYTWAKQNLRWKIE